MVRTVEKFVHRFLAGPDMRPLRHITLFFVVNIMILNMGFPDDEANTWTEKRWTIHISYVFFFLLAFYVNIYYGVPRLLLKNKLGGYGLFMVTIMGLIILVIMIIQILLLNDFSGALQRLPKLEFVINLMSSLANVGLILAGITTALLYRHWALIQTRSESIRINSLYSELNLLKNQINPHFLFNMLNNVNVLIKKDNREAADVIFKLEDLIRYQTEESSRETVSLLSEMTFLNDYLNLERLRRDRFSFRIVEGEVEEDLRIPPLLFIPFVENAAKYSQDSNESSYVYVMVMVFSDRLSFQCVNSKPAIPVRKGKTGGIGLENIRRRLELLYPGHYELELRDEQKFYIVNLQIPL